MGLGSASYSNPARTATREPPAGDPSGESRLMNLVNVTTFWAIDQLFVHDYRRNGVKCQSLCSNAKCLDCTLHCCWSVVTFHPRTVVAQVGRRSYRRCQAGSNGQIASPDRPKRKHGISETGQVVTAQSGRRPTGSEYSIPYVNGQGS